MVSNTVSTEDYCKRYVTDPEIVEILDDYMDCIYPAADYVIAHDERSPDTEPLINEVTRDLERAIAQRIWEEKSDTLDRMSLADRRWVRKESMRRALDLTCRLFEEDFEEDFEELFEED